MAGDVLLRAVLTDDLPVLFEFERDAEANWMAAFTAEDPDDRAAFMAHWARVLADDTVTKRAIICDGQVAGSIVCYLRAGTPEVGYWLGRPFWGRGVATRALALLLRQVTRRPIYARVVKDNAGSLRVLQKCGFVIQGEDRGYANARRAEVEEYILRLGAAPGEPRDARA
ncbi:MAG TPA: GNAT family N-acetyltransferase [Ktedonobacterales bacterium]|nr:GNAT family N-acetyltransferase [Ktedonobacterales bacterium]